MCTGSFSGILLDDPAVLEPSCAPTASADWRRRTKVQMLASLAHISGALAVTQRACSRFLSGFQSRIFDLSEEQLPAKVLAAAALCNWARAFLFAGFCCCLSSFLKFERYFAGVWLNTPTHVSHNSSSKRPRETRANFG